MMPLDRMLCVTAALSGIGAFVFVLRGVGDPPTCIPAGSCPSASSV